MRKKLAVSNLELGMYVEELDRPWLETPFLIQGFHLATEEDILDLQRLCDHVYIDTQQSLSLAPSSSCYPGSFGSTSAERRETSVPRRHENPVLFAEDVKEAKDIHDRTKNLIDTMHDDVRAGRQIDTEGAKAVVGDMVSSVIRNPDATLWMTQLKHRDHYTALHSMNVCALSLIFGNYLGLAEQTLHELGLGALLHDIGKLHVPLEVLNKPDKLTEREFELMRQHPTNGVDLLFNSKKLAPAVVDVVHSHHERISGRGYPRALTGQHISFYSMIVAIVDVYDALTSDRVYRDGMPNAEAMKLMYGLRNRDFDTDLLEEFIQCLGMSPSGSLVELNTGEVGLIIPSNKKQRLKPLIMLILDENKRKYYPLRILDLKLFEFSASRPEIKKVLPPGTYGIDVFDYAGEIASAKSVK